MKYFGLNEIREVFLKFFERKEHFRMRSASLIPQSDKSLLLINSGMAPLKPYFSGLERPPSKRVATCQKCIRTNDIDNVGLTERHCSFFEMLGNFSFGDYFKEEIIPWSWEFLTEVMEIDPNRLYPSVYLDDDEAFEIWEKKVGIPKERICRLGKEDNFWEIGLGPCGPCSEIYFDRGEKYGCGKPGCAVGCDCDRFMEIWNLVFTQYEKLEDGSYARLKQTNIDTGMGLERISLVIQDAQTVFDVDTLKAVREEVCRLSNVKYMENPVKDISVRIITDHIRAVVFMTADGILPSNEGRGYVLRRLLRRAALHGKKLGIRDMFLTSLAAHVIEISKAAYPELDEKRDYVFKLLSVEEKRFYETLDQGVEIIREYVAKMKSAGIKKMPGPDAFKLFDTYGFPVELLSEILAEEELEHDREGFAQELNKQRERGRAARETSNYMGADSTVFDSMKLEPTVFTGYNTLIEKEARILAVVQDEDESISVILDKTSFYAESGGQMGDKGVIRTETGEAEITRCFKAAGGKFCHVGIITKGFLSEGQRATAEVCCKTRNATARNHSATHLIHKALRQILGNHIEQAGSFVTDERLRFDFTHFAPMTPEEIRRVEDIVNEKALEALEVDVSEMGVDEAKKLGATALFGEKYGEVVRVVNMSGYSVELCGGTHVKNTAQIGAFKIIGEFGIAAGVRRIEALTGLNALGFLRRYEESVLAASVMLKTTPELLLQRIEVHLATAKDMGRELDALRRKMSGNIVDDLIGNAEIINGIKIVAAKMDDMDINGLRTLGDAMKDRLKSGVLILTSGKDGKWSLIVMATDDAVAKGIHACNLVKAAAQAAGGSGGGKPQMAQAGIKEPEKFGAAVACIKNLIGSLDTVNQPKL